MFRRLPTFGGDPRAVAEILNGAMDGKTNNTGTITLETGNATSTTLYDARISIETKIVLIPFSSDCSEYRNICGCGVGLYGQNLWSLLKQYHAGECTQRGHLFCSVWLAVN